MVLNALEMTKVVLERQVITPWKRKQHGKKMNQVVYIETQGGKRTSRTRHEPVRNAVENK